MTILTNSKVYAAFFWFPREVLKRNSENAKPSFWACDYDLVIKLQLLIIKSNSWLQIKVEIGVTLMLWGVLHHFQGLVAIETDLLEFCRLMS